MACRCGESRLVISRGRQGCLQERKHCRWRRVVFNIGGNRYRLVVRFDYSHRIGFVRFVGTHAEYDRIDASKV